MQLLQLIEEANTNATVNLASYFSPSANRENMIETTKYVPQLPARPNQKEPSYRTYLEDIQENACVSTAVPDYSNTNTQPTFGSNTLNMNNNGSLVNEHNPSIIIFNENIMSHTVCKIGDGIILDESGGCIEYLI